MHDHHDAPAKEHAPHEEHQAHEAPATAPKSDNTSLMAVLSYIGPLVIVSYLTSREDPFVKFHIKQGLVLFVIELVLWVIATMFWFLIPFIPLLQLAIFILSIVGIVNVINKKEAQLPLVGRFADNFKI